MKQIRKILKKILIIINKLFSKFGFFNPSQLRRRIKAIAKDVRPLNSRLLSTVDKFSGGNQQKVLLGRWLVRQPSVPPLVELSRGVCRAA